MAPNFARRRVIWQPVVDAPARSGKGPAVASTPSASEVTVEAKQVAKSSAPPAPPVPAAIKIAGAEAPSPAPPATAEPVNEFANRAKDVPTPPAIRPSKSKKGSGIVRPGDWACPCGVNVFASKTACFKCGTTREDCKGQPVSPGSVTAQVSNGSTGSSEVRPGDWSCPGCGLNVFASKTACFKCGATKDSAVKGRRYCDTDQSTDASDDRLSGADNDSNSVSSDKTPREGTEATPRDSSKPSYARAFLLSIRRQLGVEDSLPSDHLHTQPRPEEPPPPKRPEPFVSISNSDTTVMVGSGKSWADAQRLRRQEAAAAASAQADEQPLDDAVIARRAKAVLNKLTPEKFDVLCEKLLQCGVRAESHAEILAKAIFEAVMQQNLGSMYADLCVRLMDHFGDEGYLLRDALLAHCWQAFEPPAEAFQDFEGAGTDEASTTPMTTPSNADSEDREVERTRRKKRGLGSVRFMGELFVRNLLFPYGIISCLNCLLQAPIAAENLELAIALLTVIGPVFDTSAWVHYADLRSVFWTINGLIFDPNITPRVRCLLRDVLELRDANWVDTKRATAKERPKRLEDVRWEAQEEKNGAATPTPSRSPIQRAKTDPLPAANNSWASPGVELPGFSPCASNDYAWPPRQQSAGGFDEESSAQPFSGAPPSPQHSSAGGGVEVCPPPSPEAGMCNGDAFGDFNGCESMWQLDGQDYSACGYVMEPGHSDMWYSLSSVAENYPVDEQREQASDATWQEPCCASPMAEPLPCS